MICLKKKSGPAFPRVVLHRGVLGGTETNDTRWFRRRAKPEQYINLDEKINRMFKQLKMEFQFFARGETEFHRISIFRDGE